MQIDYLDVTGREALRVIEVVRAAAVTTAVPACPDWDLAALCGHLGRVHRWATIAASTGKQPEGGFGPKPPDGVAAVDYLADGIEPLRAALGSLRPDSAGWTFVGTDDAGHFWPRRQAQETMVHRWDVESAVGSPTPFSADLASDGLDEAFRTMVPFRLAGRKGPLPTMPGDVHLHATDTDSEWVIEAPGSHFTITDTHRKCDVAIRGSASDLLLFVWRRLGPDHQGLDIVGDRDVAEAFYDLRLLG